MILYHGSNVVVETPRILKIDRGRDFGPAFYLTPNKNQAERMALRKVIIEGNGKPIVSCFEWDENVEDVLYKNYKNADSEWLKIVSSCRKTNKKVHPFDIVEGKIADDKVGITITLYVNGLINEKETISKLKYQKTNSQIAFCSEKSLMHLKYINNYEVVK